MSRELDARGLSGGGGGDGGGGMRGIVGFVLGQVSPFSVLDRA